MIKNKFAYLVICSIGLCGNSYSMESWIKSETSSNEYQTTLKNMVARIIAETLSINEELAFIEQADEITAEAYKERKTVLASMKEQNVLTLFDLQNELARIQKNDNQNITISPNIEVKCLKIN